MEQYETRGGRLCGEMFDMSVNKSVSLKACRTFTTLGSPRVEVRLGLHGLCRRRTIHLEEEQRDLAHRGLTLEDGPFVAMRNTWTLDQLA